MENLKEKKAYYERLRTHTDMIKKLEEDSKNKGLVKILLVPETEKDLEFANTYLNFFDDSAELVINASLDNIKEINLDNSIFVQYFATLIKHMYSGTDIEQIEKEMSSYISKEESTKSFARILYEMIALFSSNPDETLLAISSKSGIDLTDELVVMQLPILLERAKENTNKLVPSVEKEQDYDGFIKFANYFREICNENSKGKNADDMFRDMFRDIFGNNPHTRRK